MWNICKSILYFIRGLISGSTPVRCGGKKKDGAGGFAACLLLCFVCFSFYFVLWFWYFLSMHQKCLHAWKTLDIWKYTAVLWYHYRQKTSYSSLSSSSNTQLTLADLSLSSTSSCSRSTTWIAPRPKHLSCSFPVSSAPSEASVCVGCCSAGLDSPARWLESIL